MGIAGNLWDLLKPYARNEGFDFLRNKRVAVDLSFFIVQNGNDIKTHVTKPHLRLIFFRTIELFTKFGAFPVFVVEKGLSAEKRNRSFSTCIQQRLELIELLGMPVLKAKGEAEALCAQLNCQGHKMFQFQFQP